MSWDVMGPVMDLSFDVKSSKSQVTAWHNGAPVPAPMPRGPLPQREARLVMEHEIQCWSGPGRVPYLLYVSKQYEIG